MTRLKNVHVNLPFPMLVQILDEILAMEIQPEIYFSGATLDQLSWKDVEKTSRALERKNIPVTFHGPFMDLSPGAVDEKIRDVTRFRFRQVLELAPHFHPRVIVLHPGYDRWCFDHNVDLWLKNSLHTWIPLVEQARLLSVRLVVENVFEENPSVLKALLDAVNSPHLGFCLDAGHGNLFSEVPLTEWIETLGPRLMETHLHDNHGQADEHLPIGQGGIDFARIFSTLRSKNIRPIHTIEPHVREHLEPSLKALEQYL